MSTSKATALEKVRQDKLREVLAGHDGTWVAHPGLVPVAKEVFDAHMKEPNQISRRRDDVSVTAKDLLAVAEGKVTEEGLLWNIDVGLQYMESWLRGSGCVPIYNLMEDAATAEISRTQVWQWLHHGAHLNDGRKITPELVRETIASQLQHIRSLVGEQRFERGKFHSAAGLFEEMMTNSQLQDFLTLAAYPQIE